MITDYHAKYFAHELTKRCSSDSVEKLAGAVASAQVDLNPHQVDVALFAFKSPLSKGDIRSNFTAICSGRFYATMLCNIIMLHNIVFMTVSGDRS